MMEKNPFMLADRIPINNLWSSEHCDHEIIVICVKKENVMLISSVTDHKILGNMNIIFLNKNKINIFLVQICGEKLL